MTLFLKSCANWLKMKFKRVVTNGGHYFTRQRNYKCDSCGVPCDGTLPMPFGSNKIKFILCPSCFDREYEAAKPLLHGNSYHLEPLDA